jgi:hypothetical protein
MAGNARSLGAAIAAEDGVADALAFLQRQRMLAPVDRRS